MNSPIQLAGGGDFDMRQEAVNNAYRVQTVAKTRPEMAKEVMESIEVKPDIFDKVYVGLREYVPSWMLLSFIVIGAFTVFIYKFKKPIRRFLLAILKEG